jgi:hypothetical protein
MNSNVDEIKIDDPVIRSDQIVQFESESAPEPPSILFSGASMFEWHIVIPSILDSAPSTDPIPIAAPFDAATVTVDPYIVRFSIPDIPS